MTAIAYRNGIVAADSVGWVADSHVKIPVARKIRRYSDLKLIACVGSSSDIEAFHDWTSSGGERPSIDKDSGFVALRADTDGSVFLADYTLRWVPVKHPFIAVGHPDRFMMGAMFAGASAAEAVALAIAHTDGAGGDVQIVHLLPQATGV